MTAELDMPDNKQMYSVIDDHCDSIKSDYESAKQKFIDLCKIVQNEGYPPNEAWQRIKENLRDLIPQRTLYFWGDYYLPEGAKKATRPKKIATLQSLPDRTIDDRFNTDETAEVHTFNCEGMGVAIIEEEEENDINEVTISSKIEKDNAELAKLRKENASLRKKLEEYERSPNNDSLYNKIDLLKKEVAQLKTENLEAKPFLESSPEDKRFFLEIIQYQDKGAIAKQPKEDQKQGREWLLHK